MLRPFALTTKKFHKKNFKNVSIFYSFRQIYIICVCVCVSIIIILFIFVWNSTYVQSCETEPLLVSREVTVLHDRNSPTIVHHFPHQWTILRDMPEMHDRVLSNFATLCPQEKLENSHLGSRWNCPARTRWKNHSDRSLAQSERSAYDRKSAYNAASIDVVSVDVYRCRGHDESLICSPRLTLSLTKVLPTGMRRGGWGEVRMLKIGTVAVCQRGLC